MTADAIAIYLEHVAPAFQPREEAAHLLEQLGEQYQVDPALVVRYVKSESDWNPNAENIHRTGYYVGLGQLRLANYAECREAVTSTPCLERRASLFDWRANLTEVAHDFALARAYCKEVAHVNGARYWLQIVKGYDKRNHTTCGHRGGRARPIPQAVLQLVGANTSSVAKKHKAHGGTPATRDASTVRAASRAKSGH